MRTFTVVSAGNNCFVLFAGNYEENLYFLVTKGNLTLVFHKGVNSISSDESSPLIPTTCLLSLVSNGNLILLFLYGSKISYSSQVIRSYACAQVI